ncbi:Oidioi.mRNA.OKI2018_I69.chr1.g3085.t1.cds [Oikopleura dioica]|uniref:Oidioi.mRNA.OKI2018_I69.chr1.g3085.t1.cds n=1 Tax=Oikopleura dioica TaxID=34765 RepID=A0ABN7SXE8_OIKDI|nr:Oidioi.mRNA.OKI2018_I69.chr1.g3085.t1.cds [Oikopleura dioica]
MHYDQYSFVTGSTPSITTKVEYFNKIIGQRRGFSVGDHQKINHLYKCPRPLRNSVTSGFDKFRFFDGFA